MISICVPVYNFYIARLVNALSAQVQLLPVPAEIIIIDDGSREEIRTGNRKACKDVQYIELGENTGRAKIRNRFLHYARYDYLLFLDCDGKIISDNFLSMYTDQLNGQRDTVICGGRIYQAARPERNKLLRWKYGIKRESQPPELRNVSPNASFMTNNFVIRKDIFSQVNFDERIIHYGHEDTLLGYRLKQKRIEIIHIDNPVLNDHLESNTVYLKKTTAAIKNLPSILGYADFDNAFIHDVKLLRTWSTINSYNITGLVYIGFLCLEPFISRCLKAGYFRMWMFDLYKLGMFIQALKQQHNKP
jgi:glycosyltransferase involved in cell wall biosynthesis